MEISVPSLVEKTKPIYNKAMSSYHKRLETFRNWPKTNGLSPEKLCESGFYYSGINDKVGCFYCGVLLNEWSKYDDPWIEHCLYSNTCSFLLLNKPKLKTNLMKEDDDLWFKKIMVYFISFILVLAFVDVTIEYF